VVRQGIRTNLSARHDWEICGEGVNGQEAIKLAEELRPDAIIMDITMPVDKRTGSGATNYQE
jgi:DNA-binding NarL/FixJ family response regulator